MSGARDEILRRIATALEDVGGQERPADMPVARAYRGGEREVGDATAALALAELLEERLRDYGAATRRIAGEDVAFAVGRECERLGIERLGVPIGLPRGWRPQRLELVEDADLSHQQLDALDGVLTGCAVAVAQTGTLALDGEGACGRRALTLVPDRHLCVVLASGIVETVPQAIAALAPAAVERRRPITLVSGPSATSDIELERVAGVHGPRTLSVLVVDDRASASGEPRGSADSA